MYSVGNNLVSRAHLRKSSPAETVHPAFLYMLCKKFRATYTTDISPIMCTPRAYCIQVFKYFDIGLTGRLDYNQFFAAMTRLNFVGVQVWYTIYRRGCGVPRQYVRVDPRTTSVCGLVVNMCYQVSFASSGQERAVQNDDTPSRPIRPRRGLRAGSSGRTYRKGLGVGSMFTIDNLTNTTLKYPTVVPQNSDSHLPCILGRKPP